MSAAGNSNEFGSMSAISQNMSALLEVPLEEHGTPRINVETSGNVYSTCSSSSITTICKNCCNINVFFTYNMQPKLGYI